MKKIFCKSGCIDLIPDILKKNKIKNVFLLTGNKSFYAIGAAEKVKAWENDFNIIRFFEFSVNPRFEDVVKGAELLIKSKSHIIIAVGGGSVIDMAKLINAMANTKDEGKRIENNNAGFYTLLPFIAIPSTAGSGSEATHFAAMFKEGRKYSVTDYMLKPDYVILDPALLQSLDKKQISISALDALSQAIESLWSVNCCEESKMYATRALELVYSSILKVLKKKDIKELARLMIGAHFAGRAINLTKTTAAHALSYTLTSKFNIPHGHSVALILGNLFKYNYPNFDELKVMNIYYQKNSWNIVRQIFGCKNPEDFSEKWFGLMRAMGLNTNLMGILKNDENIRLIVDNVNIERLKNNPVEFTRENLFSIIKSV